jgi:hypothetical protein
LTKTKSPLFFFFGGWCPNLTSLIHKKDGSFERQTTFEDIQSRTPEKVTVSIQHNNGLVSLIKCGLPEYCVAIATLEWDPNGLFIMKTRFSSDWEGKHDVGRKLKDIEIRTICQNLLYNEVKECHHIHTHHDDEEDGLLKLLSLGNSDTALQISLAVDEIQKDIISHVYKQYSQAKPSGYTENLKKILDKDPSTNQLEQAIRVLYEGIGESIYGLSFLGMYGSKVFTDARINEEHIKLESIMRSLEALKGRYTLDFMKRNRSHVDIKQLVEAITKGVTEAVLGVLKK